MNIKELILKKEESLSEYACLSKDGYRLNKDDDDIDMRPMFMRDADRIINSLSYTRYIDKTQVFSKKNNDHITKRIIHVTLVSKIARTIGRALNLNEDLIEAMALGHDIGHVPFGHIGEKALSEVSVECGEGYFNHNIQSVRNFMYIEETNLSMQVLDGIMCHNGEFLSSKYYPKHKTKEEFISEYEDSYKDKNAIKHLIPSTLEGCVVRISDIIGYVGRDLEDALMLGVIKKDEIPEKVTKVLGNTNKSITNTIIKNIISNSYNKPYLMMTDEVYDAVKTLKDFEQTKIYPKAMMFSYDKYLEMFKKVFDKCLNDLNDETSDINIVFLSNCSKEYLKNTTNERKVIDYIAGMTDNFFLKEYEKSFDISLIM